MPLAFTKSKILVKIVGKFKLECGFQFVLLYNACSCEVFIWVSCLFLLGVNMNNATRSDLKKWSFNIQLINDEFKHYIFWQTSMN